MIRQSLIGIMAAAIVATFSVPAFAELTLCNRTSYRMDVAIGLEKRANVETRGWYHLNPGQCQKVVDGTLDIDMAYVHARTSDVYGSAPIPQNGNADFCIRPTDFAIAAGRDCPISQQVRFSPARPSDSEKGPVINLAEESDYDDEQARLAGIQRLLVIAGYDANPIDGVQGSKTQAAIKKFLADRKLPADIVDQDSFFQTLLTAAQNPQGHGFAWCNDTKHPVMASLGVVEMGSIVTRGWYRIEAGKCLRPAMRGDPYRVYSYGEAVDSNGRAIKEDGKTLAWGGDVTLCTRDGKFELSDHKDCATRGLNSAGFATVDLKAQPSMTIHFKEP